MARSRNIKPGYFHNDLLAEVAPLGRLLFAGLWTLADRAGRLEDRPKRIKAGVLPYDDCDVDSLLSQLSVRGFIHRYVADGNNLIEVVNFAKHQNPHCKEQASTLPAPNSDGASPVQPPDQTWCSRADSLNPIPAIGSRCAPSQTDEIATEGIRARERLEKTQIGIEDDDF
jgi:hypothetical protein